MADATQQYRPIAARMTQANAPLSVRTIRTMADNLVNYQLYVGNHKVIGQPCVPSWKSHASTTEERVILPFAARNVPDGFQSFALVLHHRRTAGASDVTWRVYCSRWPYRGDVAMAASELSPDYSVGTITSTIDSLKRATTTFQIVRGTVDLEPDICWLILTAQNGDGSTRGEITSIDIWPITPNTESGLTGA